MTREELIHFMEWWDKRYYPSRLQFHREKDADKYLAEHTLPPAEGAEHDHQHDHPLDHLEGAEEITAKKYLSDHGYGSGTNYSSVLVAALMTEFATLHAQRLAEKMVEEKLRGELIAYDKWTSKQGWGKWLDDNNSEKYVDEYLKSIGR